MTDKFKNIPEEMKQKPNWVGATLEILRDKKGNIRYKKDGVTPLLDKSPRQSNKRFASCDKSNTWNTFDNIVNSGLKGLGFQFGEKKDNRSGYVGIDFDGISDQVEQIKRGNFENEVGKILNQIGSYAEYSPSGKGIHIILRSGVREALKTDFIEVYDHGRYFTVTGDVIPGFETIKDFDETTLNKIVDKYRPKNEVINKSTEKENTNRVEVRDQDVLKIASKSKTGMKFDLLYYNGQGDTDDSSALDIALCNYLAFYCGKDIEQMDRIFRKSALYRPKWDEVHSSTGETYGQITIAKAINDTLEVYNPNKNYKDLEMYSYLDGKGNRKIDPIKLAEYLRNNANYRIVRKKGTDSELLYWYENGRYSITSKNEFHGRIKKYIPLGLRRTAIYEECYKELITDLNTINYDDLDNIPGFINFKNGLLEISTGILYKHSPQFLFTRQIPFDFDYEYNEYPIFTSYMKQLTNNDTELAMIIQEYLGLTISNVPGYKVKKCLILYGLVGNTGKTQLTRLIKTLLGVEYIANTPIQRLSERFALSELVGARCLLVDDQSGEAMNDSSIFKAIVGGSDVSVEAKGKTPYSFLYKGTTIIATNDLPYIADDKGNHLFERFLIIPCDNVIPEEKRDPGIFEKMMKEIPGIIQWCLQGLKRLISNNYKFTVSSKTKLVLEMYRKQNDTVYDFITEFIVKTNNPQDRIPRPEFYNKYQLYCISEDRKPVSNRKITERVEKNGFNTIKSCGENYFYPMIWNPYKNKN